MNEFSPEGRRRGRPTNAEREANQAAEQAEEKPQPARVEATKQRRRRRDDLNEDARRRRLYVPDEAKDPNFVYRWINDTTMGRVKALTEHDDWEIVSKEDMKGLPSQANDAGIGTQMSRVVGETASGAQSAVLVRKPREFHEEDEAKKQAAIDKREEDMRRSAPTGDGHVDASHAYIPGGRNIIGGR